jgi:putative hydroxymethylpyrimidine transport system substrate-binding protein
MKKLTSILLAVALTLSLAACSNASGNSNQTNTASSDANAQSTASEDTADNTALEDFSIVLDWYPNAVHAFLSVALEKGYYAEEGLNVEIQFPANVNDAITMTAAGKADAGLYYQPTIITTAANQNIPIKILGTVVQHPLNIVMSMTDSNIKGAKDLVGKTVGYPSTVDNEYYIKAMMEHNGLSFEDTTMQDVGFDLNTALITGNVDAVIGAYINHEYPTLLEEGYDVTYFEVTQEGVPDYEELVLITGENQIENESDKLARFIRASKKGFEDMLNDPDEALSILLSNQDEANYPLDEAVEKVSMDILLPMMASDAQGFLEINEESWQATEEWLKTMGLIDNDVDIQTLIADIEE